MTAPRARWVVAVTDVGHGDGDPIESGPYTEQRARQVADGFNRRRGDDGWFATAYPLTRRTIPELVALHDPQEGGGDV